MFGNMNYDNYTSQIRITPPKAAKLLRRKPAPKPTRPSRLLSALRKVTGVAAIFALSTVARADFFFQPTTEAASKDTKIYEHVGDSNFSSDLSAYGPGSGGHFASLVQFDISSLSYPSPLEITSATLRLYATRAGINPGNPTGDFVPGTVTISPILGAWRETAGSPSSDPLATYFAFFGTPEVLPSEEGPGSSALSPTLGIGSPVASQFISTTGQFIDFDVTELVRSWYAGTATNNGFIIQMGGAGIVGFDDVDKNSAPGSAPSLTVVPEPGSALLAFVGAATCMVRRRRSSAK